MLFKRTTLIGVGLLGGSLGRAMRERGLSGHVTGYVRREASISECLAARAVDSAVLDVQEAVRGADLVVLCTPLSQMAPLTRQLAPFLKRGCIVTDVGSVKGSVVKGLEKALRGYPVHFIGSHPMAGSEKMGVAAARADLFEQAICVVTPAANAAPGATRKVERLWREVGSRVLRLNPAEHDLLVSRSSHLPHVLAAALTNLVLGSGQGMHQGQLCATGFRDTTRIASGSPEMWRDIALANRQNLTKVLGDLVTSLNAFTGALKRQDEQAIYQFFDQARSLRELWASGSRLQSPE